MGTGSGCLAFTPPPHICAGFSNSIRCLRTRNCRTTKCGSSVTTSSVRTRHSTAACHSGCGWISTFRSLSFDHHLRKNLARASTPTHMTRQSPDSNGCGVRPHFVDFLRPFFAMADVRALSWSCRVMCRRCVLLLPAIPPCVRLWFQASLSTARSASTHALSVSTPLATSHSHLTAWLLFSRRTLP